MVTSPEDPAAFGAFSPPVVAPGVAAGGLGTGGPVHRAGGVAGRRGAPLPVAALVATLWAALLSFAPVLALVAAGVTGSSATAPDVARLAGASWLLVHGVAVQTPADRLTLVPLALTLLVVWRSARAGIHVSRAIGAHRARRVYRALGAGAAVAVIYAVLGAAVAVGCSTPDVTVSTGGAALTLAAVGGVPAMLGAVLHSRAGRMLLRGLPAVIGDGLRAGVLAGALIVAVGAVAAGTALALHGGDAAEVLNGFHAGVGAQAGITLACLAYVPNAAIWAAAYLIGPGFAMGAGTTVSPGAVLLGPVPALPLLPALPNAPVSGFAPAMLGAPLLAALVAGWLLARRRDTGWRGLLGAAALAAPVTGVLLTVAAGMSAGALGSGRLSVIGPQAWPVGAWGTAIAAAGLLAGAAAARARPRPRSA